MGNYQVCFLLLSGPYPAITSQLGIMQDPERPKQTKSSQMSLPLLACYNASRVIDALVKTERTKGASSPGWMVVGTIV